MISSSQENFTKQSKTAPEKRRGWKSYAVNLQPKELAVSSALGEYIHDRVDIYEYENVFALVNNPIGEYHVSLFAANSYRKMIYSRPLTRYIQEKCGHSFSLKFAAWHDGDVVLFCIGSAGENLRFHDGFTSVTDLIRLRYNNSVRINGHRFIVSAALSVRLGDRLTIYEQGKVFAFINDENGMLKPSLRNEFGTKAIKSEKLIRYVEKKLGKDIMYGITVPNGVAFSNDRQIREKNILLSNFKAVDCISVADNTKLPFTM